jgi:hypothetical protein
VINIGRERPASQATAISIGSYGLLQFNTIKHNPAVMSGVQSLMYVFLAIFLGNLMSYLIEDFQSADDLSDYVAWLFGEIVFNIFILRILFPLWGISQKQGFRQFMKSAVLELASDFKIDIGLQVSNTSRLRRPTKSNINTNVVTIETTRKTPEEATLHNNTIGWNALIKSEVEEQEDVNTPQQTLPLNTVNMELQEANDKSDQKNAKGEIRTQFGKGKGKGKGQSNFKKGKTSGQKHTSDNKPEEMKQESRWKEEDKKITRSTLASRRALKKWKERTKQLQVRKSVRVCLSRNNTINPVLYTVGL